MTSLQDRVHSMREWFSMALVWALVMILLLAFVSVLHRWPSLVKEIVLFSSSAAFLGSVWCLAAAIWQVIRIAAYRGEDE